ncbi:MAG: tRNA lysidine(34) synthetase TilS [Spirosomataceae bacterium]
MLKDFLGYIKEKQLFSASARLLLTVSGGIDSVVLAHLCHRSKLVFGIAHCNFQLRGSESDEDEQFVRDLAHTYAVPFYTQRFDTKTFAAQHGISTQMAARQLRYEWFAQIRREENYDHILTAHHQDDLLETVLLNLTRGTGLAGLHGILPKNGFLVRPLLFAARTALFAYLQQMKLTWREDSSNETNDYLRNRLRHAVIPILQEMNPKVSAAVAELAEHVIAAEEIIAESLRQTAAEAVQSEGGVVRISYEKTIALSAPIERLWYRLKAYGFSYRQTKLIWESRNGQVGKQFYSPTHTLINDRQHWLITPTDANTSTTWTINSEEGELSFPGGRLTWHPIELKEEFAFKTTPNVIYLNTEQLLFPLTLRPWRAGERFCPAGMQGKQKKISDFLIDCKVPRTLKEKVFVLESDNKIAWIIGFRSDERFKATESTKKITKFTLTKNN